MEKMMKLTDFIELLPPDPRSVKILPRRHWEARIGGASSIGDSSGEAAERLRRTVEKAFDGDYDPSVMLFRDYIGVLWRETFGWRYNIKRLSDVSHVQKMGSCSYFDTEQQALHSLCMNLAQDGWDGQEMESPLLLSKNDQDDFSRWARYQKRYQELAATGMDNTAIHNQIWEERL